MRSSSVNAKISIHLLVLCSKWFPRGRVLLNIIICYLCFVIILKLQTIFCLGPYSILTAFSRIEIKEKWGNRDWSVFGGLSETWYEHVANLNFSHLRYRKTKIHSGKTKGLVFSLAAIPCGIYLPLLSFSHLDWEEELKWLLRFGQTGIHLNINLCFQGVTDRRFLWLLASKTEHFLKS